ncbi:GNAT family N-acetyltransferase (plasmid) [Cupriavidus basilensis]|uniref:GNAT family N-acetyltransferase n=2 Tax=Betaproteobacteria TaxID=28216 RepID=A0A643FKS8_9BURK|nr:GNAT family N-acetyltransferase [Cupriavidus basilensis]
MWRLKQLARLFHGLSSRQRVVLLDRAALDVAQTDMGPGWHRVHLFRFIHRGSRVGYLTLVRSSPPDPRLPLALCSGDPLPVEVADLYIESCYRGQGIGSALWRQGCEAISEIYPASCLVYGTPQGKDAARFWLRQGFQISDDVMFANLGDLTAISKNQAN